MKKYYFFLYALVMFIFSCSENYIENTNEYLPITTINVSAKNFEGTTRTTINKSNYSISWNANDMIGIFPKTDQSKQIAFRLSNIIDGQNASFDGKGWGIKSDTEYVAYYPLVNKALIDKSSIELVYSGQKQNGNGSTTHLSAYDFLKTSTTRPNNNALNLEFEHLGTLVHLNLNIPNGTYRKAVLNSDGYFYTKAILDLGTGVAEPVEDYKTHSISLDFENVSVVDGKLEIFTIIYPVDLEDSSISVSVFNESGDNFSTTLEGKLFQPGTVWSYDGNLRYIPYLTFKAGQAQTFQMSKAVESLEYSVNNSSWQTLGTNTVSFGGSIGELKVRGKSALGTATSSDNFSKIIFGNTEPVACSGDIRTLLDYDNYTTVSTSNARFCSLFSGCTSLITAPLLPATSLAKYAYYSMFEDCTSLTVAPELPATKLEEACYAYMFLRCAGLTTTPELPATILTDFCYAGMFTGCANVKHIKMLATNISSFWPLDDWTKGVASSGIFVKNVEASWNVSGRSGIPSGWMTIYYDTTSKKYFKDSSKSQECDDHGN